MKKSLESAGQVPAEVGSSPPGGIEPPPPDTLTGGHLALDFLNGRPTPCVCTVWPRDGIELVDWLVQAGEIDEADARRLREGDGDTLDEVAERARSLRGWLRGFVARHAGRALGETADDELRPLNDLLERDSSHLQVEFDDQPGAVPGSDRRSLRLHRVQGWTDPEQILQPVARAIADLVTDVDFRRIRAGEGEAHGLLFLDAAKGQAVRRCSVFPRTTR